MPEIEPVIILERSGVDDFYVDYKKNIVYLRKDELHKIADYFNMKLFLDATSFERFGWTYKRG